MTFMNLAVRPSGVAVLTINVPDSKLNVLSTPLMSELEATLDRVASDRSIKGLVIISGKEDNFFAGANLEEILAIQTQPAIASYEATQRGKAIFAKIAALPYPTVAAVHGVCLGGGTELALACKYRLVSDSPKTKLGLPEVGLGFLPGWGGSVRLPKLVGLEAAADLILQPLKTWDAKKAWRNGLADEIVAEANLLARAEEVASGARVRRAKAPLKVRAQRYLLTNTRLGRAVFAKMAGKGIYAETRGNYPAPPATLKVMLAAFTMPEAKAFEYESATFARLATTQESRNLVGIFFATQEAKKAPGGAVPEIKVRKVGVLGAGVMGAGIAQAAAYAGYQVILYDKFPEGLERGRKFITGLFSGLVEKRKLTVTESAKLQDAITYSTDFASLAGCDLVIEAIIEDMGAKQAVVKQLDATVGKPYIFATNTSSLSVTEMASVAAHPERCGGLHFFNPVHKMPLVEVIATEQTSPATTAALKAFATRLNKTAVDTTDSPAFAVNRILAPFLYETIKLVESGVPLQDLDDSMKRYGMPMGPLTLLDTVGLDVAVKVIHVLHAALGDRMAPPAILEYFTANKLLGMKGGKGFFLYDAKGKRLGFNPDLQAAIKAAAQPKSRGEIQERLVLAMINEAARCLEEGVCTDPSQIDLAMIMGTGFPPFRGGVLRVADQMGVRDVVTKLNYLSTVAGENYKPCNLLVRMAETGQTFYR